MEEKHCRTCGKLKPLSDYYKHPQMGDGHLNICKECTKKRVAIHREDNVDRIREYDRGRAKLLHRRALNLARTIKARKTIRGYESAHNAVDKAIIRGDIIKPSVCSWCGKEHSQIEGHHTDYSDKLLVVWLCSPCHRRLHIGKGEEAEKMRAAIPIPKMEERTEFRKLKTITYNGITESLSYWAKETGMTYNILQHRLNNGWNHKDIIEKPRKNNGKNA